MALHFANMVKKTAIQLIPVVFSGWAAGAAVLYFRGIPQNIGLADILATIVGTISAIVIITALEMISDRIKW